ncbi:MAG: prepilin-type N-terminal cleavage/methylation domain-containing protein [Firmicutes bacterium]|nr:prepilin-type N-terminal cleavage/methylation domain-containing protein [Bacillota bacterium]
MKRGFALLETIIVITFLSVSMLMLYGTFNNMINNSKKNILYDDASNIYKVHFVKEYLSLNNLNNLLDNSDIKTISCDNFGFESCNKIIDEFNINKIYLSKYDLKEYKEDNYTSNFNNYMNTLSNKDNFKYRFIVEFNNNNTYSYASIGLNGEDHE